MKGAFRGHAIEESIPDPAFLPTRLMTPKVDPGLKANAVERRPQATGVEITQADRDPSHYGTIRKGDLLATP